MRCGGNENTAVLIFRLEGIILALNFTFYSRARGHYGLDLWTADELKVGRLDLTYWAQQMTFRGGCHIDQEITCIKPLGVPRALIDP